CGQAGTAGDVGTHRLGLGRPHVPRDRTAPNVLGSIPTPVPIISCWVVLAGTWAWTPRDSSPEGPGWDQPTPALCSAGIGKCVAMDLARRNARTILACRSRERGQAAVEEIRAATGNPAVVLRLLDTGSLASVRAFASAVLREESRLDVLVNNAGVTGLPFTITSEGLEQTFAINYLGPFLLTNLLLDLLKASAPARVVNVSSFRHSLGTADSGFLTGQRCPGGYDAAYNSTKLMNVLFTAELARRLQGTGGCWAVPGSAVPCGTLGTSPVPGLRSCWQSWGCGPAGVTANALSPGVVSTSIMRHFSWPVRALFSLLRPFMKVSGAGSCPSWGQRGGWGSAEQGAASTIFCAVSEEAAGITGKYFDSSCRLALPSVAARDAALARKLWEASERLTGLTEQD
ncbi:Retinol dehydrogenase 12, partial [Lamprotornis superbus]